MSRYDDEWVEGETGPRLYTLTLNGTTLDLTNATVTLLAYNGASKATVTIVGSVAVQDQLIPANLGKVLYSPNANDLKSADSPLLVRFRVVQNGKTLFFPNRETLAWIVRKP